MSTIDKKFSGWSVVAGCFLMSFFVNAIVGNTTSLFMAPICQQFGFDTGSYSLVTLFGALATAVAAMLLAPLLKDKNIKLVMMACVAVTGISFAVMGLCTKLWQFILVFAVSSAGLAGVSNLPIAMMVTAWFNDYRSTAMSIGFSGCSLGASFWSILFGKIISDGGWTTCYFLGGTLVAVMGLIIIPIFMKKSPQMYGQQPYISATPNNQSSKKSHGHEWLGLSKKEALKTPYFLILSIIVILIGSLYTGVITHAVNYLVSIGWDITAASTVLSLYSLVSIAGVFAGGLIFDKLGLRIGTLLSVICACIGLAALIFAHIPLFGYIYAIGFALSGLLPRLLPATLIHVIFGVKDYGAIYSLINMFFLIGASTGSVLTGIINNMWGYTPAWILYIIMSIVVFILISAALSGSKKLRDQYPNPPSDIL